jgi:hypothetical protein
MPTPDRTDEQGDEWSAFIDGVKDNRFDVT